jgi:hypothetical protein
MISPSYTALEKLFVFRYKLKSIVAVVSPEIWIVQIRLDSGTNDTVAVLEAPEKDFVMELDP